MKVTNVEKKENSTVELTIHVEADEFEAAVQKAYLKSRSRIAVPGFRKGKAPRKIIEGMYGSGVFYEDAINDVYPGAYEAAVKEQGLEDMGHPVMDIVEVNKEKGLIFTALVSILSLIHIWCGPWWLECPMWASPPLSTRSPGRSRPRPATAPASPGASSG